MKDKLENEEKLLVSLEKIRKNISKEHLILIRKLVCLVISLGTLASVSKLSMKSDASSIMSFKFNDYDYVNDIKVDFKVKEPNESISHDRIDTDIEFVSRETIIVGDSRTNGMLLSGAVDEEHAIYGVGYGFNWLVGNGNFNSNKTNAINGAISELYNRIKEDKLYNIVFWLGINDCTYVTPGQYFEEYVSIANEFSNQMIYVVSVGPVKETSKCTRSNSQVNEFNDTLKELINGAHIDNLIYIDLSIDSSFINKYDSVGLHYGVQDYINIYELIEDGISSKSLSLKSK